MDLSLPKELAQPAGWVLGVSHGSFGEVCVTTADAVTIFDAETTVCDLFQIRVVLSLALPPSV
jgi:hypothetical protein